QAGGQHREHDGHDRHLQGVAAQAGERQRQQHQRAGQQPRGGAPPRRSAQRQVEGLFSHTRIPLPNRPSGRTSRIRIMMMKASASCSTTEPKPPARLSVMPTISAAMMAPQMLPRPPMMMMANALNTNGMPMS